MKQRGHDPGADCTAGDPEIQAVNIRLQAPWMTEKPYEKNPSRRH